MWAFKNLVNFRLAHRCAPAVRAGVALSAAFFSICTQSNNDSSTHTNAYICEEMERIFLCATVDSKFRRNFNPNGVVEVSSIIMPTIWRYRSRQPEASGVSKHVYHGTETIEGVGRRKVDGNKLTKERDGGTRLPRVRRS